MSREILFRGKRVDNGEWAEGCYIKGVKAKYQNCYILPDNINQKGCDPLDGFQVYPETVGQFTGLLDKNGKKIFWDDLLKPFGAGIKFMHVKWEEGELIVYNNYGRWGHLSRFFQICSELNLEVEVIGNIHDTPDLIGKEGSNV